VALADSASAVMVLMEASAKPLRADLALGRVEYLLAVPLAALVLGAGSGCRGWHRTWRGRDAIGYWACWPAQRNLRVCFVLTAGGRER